MVGASHVIAHAVIFIAYLAAVLRVAPVFSRLLRLRAITIVAGGGFFLFCGLTHLSLAIGRESALFFVLTDHLQATSIVCFLIFLTLDVRRAVRRLTQAFVAIEVEYGTDIAARLRETIDEALRG